MKSKCIKIIGAILILFSSIAVNSQTLYMACNNDNDLYRLLLKEKNVAVKRFDTPLDAVENASKGSGVIITSPDYPYSPVCLNDNIYQEAKKKKLKIYVEFISNYPGFSIEDSVYVGKLERGVISSDFFLPELKEMDLLGLNDCHIYKAKIDKPLISFAKVAGFDVAQYGLSDTEVFPLLFKDHDNLIALSCLSNFKTARYAPNDSWKAVWNKILIWLTGKKK